MRRALLMAREDMREIRLIYFIVKREHRAARIPEDDLNSLMPKALEECPRTIHQQ